MAEWLFTSPPANGILEARLINALAVMESSLETDAI
jgi:hypothetical protein